jgi:hypothetical protein
MDTIGIEEYTSCNSRENLNNSIQTIIYSYNLDAATKSMDWTYTTLSGKKLIEQFQIIIRK